MKSGDINFFGASIFIVLFIFWGASFFQGNYELIFLFKSFKALIIAILFAIRINPSVVVKNRLKIISYASTLLPFLYFTNGDCNANINYNSILNAIFIFGECLSVTGIITLGQSFGISPAKRKLIHYGIYRYLRHPIYTGYFVTELCLLISYPEKLNFLI